MKARQSVNGQVIYGESSNVISARTAPDKCTLKGTTTDGNTRVVLTWNRSGGAGGYEIYRRAGYSGNFDLMAVIESPDILSWTDEGLSDTAANQYMVRPYIIVDGNKIQGANSAVYQKQITYKIDPALGSSVSILTQYAGFRYVFGGTTPSGWDCSGFTQWTFKNHFGITLPRSASMQCSVGTPVDVNNRAAWQPGDLLFYREGGRVGHVAVYLGGNQLIHALNEKYGTLIQDVDFYESWDRATALCAVRRYF